MTEEALKSRVLVKDGKWLVPEGERPENWRQILPDPASVLDQVIADTQAVREVVEEPAAVAAGSSPALPTFESCSACLLS